MKTLFKRLITDFHESSLKHIIQREYNIPVNSRKIISLIGVRRSGKTFLLYGLIEQLRKQVNMQNILYINFEDDRLYALKLQNLDDLIEAYFELYPHKRQQKVYLYAIDTGFKALFDAKTKSREITALQEAMKYFKYNEAILITQDEEETLNLEGQKIFIKPLWKWLLET